MARPWAVSWGGMTLSSTPPGTLTLSRGHHPSILVVVLSPCPPLHNVERGTGGEDHTGSAGWLYAQGPRLVRPRRARPAVAPHARSVPRARVGVHAAADAGEPGAGVLSAVSRAVS